MVVWWFFSPLSHEIHLLALLVQHSSVNTVTAIRFSIFSSSHEISYHQNSPFGATNFNYKILQDCILNQTIRFSLLWNLDFFYRARLSALRPTPSLKDHVSVFMPPSDRVVQLYRQAPGSLIVVFYD
jgi:hypothetical protein